VRGIAGVIADGPVRDIDEARSYEFPVFTNRTTCLTARGRVVEKETNGPVTICGLAVEAGDYVAAEIELLAMGGRLALIANGADNSISVFTITGMHLTPAGTVGLPEKSGPSDVVFTPDGKTAIAVGRGDSHLMILSVNGTQVRYTGRAFEPGVNPYGAVVTRDGKYIINTDLGGALPAPGEKPAPGARRQGTISMSDIATGKLVDSQVVGPTPEHVAMSSDGKYIAVVVANGTAPVRSDPKWDKVKGLLEIYRVGDGTLTPAGRADTGHWCQGTTFSRDDSTLLLQCAGERQIEVYHYDGTTLTRVEGADIPMGARPGSIATAHSR